jgi:hypothetical protein
MEVVSEIFPVYSRDSSIAIATGLQAGRPKNRDSISGMVKRFFLFSINSRPALKPTQPLIQWVPGLLFPGIKRPKREADHIPSSSAEDKDGGAISPLPYTSSWNGA